MSGHLRPLSSTIALLTVFHRSKAPLPLSAPPERSPRVRPSVRTRWADPRARRWLVPPGALRPRRRPPLHLKRSPAAPIPALGRPKKLAGRGEWGGSNFGRAASHRAPRASAARPAPTPAQPPASRALLSPRAGALPGLPEVTAPARARSRVKPPAARCRWSGLARTGCRVRSEGREIAPCACYVIARWPRAILK